ncbi:hypothetical protein [Streptomyces sp. NPDC002676]
MSGQKGSRSLGAALTFAAPGDARRQVGHAAVDTGKVDVDDELARLLKGE